MTRTLSLTALAVAILLADASGAFAFGRRCGGCDGGRRPLLGRVFGPMRGERVGGCPQNVGQYQSTTCPLTGCTTSPALGYPVRYTTPNCSGGVCSPCQLPTNYGFSQGCPNGVCQPAARGR